MYDGRIGRSLVGGIYFEATDDESELAGVGLKSDGVIARRCVWSDGD